MRKFLGWAICCSALIAFGITIVVYYTLGRIVALRGGSVVAVYWD